MAIESGEWHRLMRRQYKKFLDGAEHEPPGLPAFLAAVSEAYHEADADRRRLEHTIELSSQELLERNHQLQQQLAEREQREAELQRSEEARAQIADQLARLSTPLIPISDTIVVMPLIGTIDTWRIQQVTETLLQGLAQRHAEVVILDITGVPVVDSQVAQGLLQTAQAVRMLGARMLLTGIRPEVAQALVGLGIDLAAIVTFGTLQAAVAAALAQR